MVHLSYGFLAFLKAEPFAWSSKYRLQPADYFKITDLRVPPKKFEGRGN